MDKETLSNYGWIVICVLVMVVMIALAGPFGNFVADAVKSTTQGLFDVNQNALDAAGIVIDDNAFAEVEGGGSDVVGGVNHNGPTIPEGATYTKTDGTVLTAGDTFPESITNGDIYTYGDYTYTFNKSYMGVFPSIMWMNTGTYDGWHVAVTDTTKNSYGTILESINNKQTKSMIGTFMNCSSLKDASNIVIPTSVTNVVGLFYGCSALTDDGLPTIPNGITNLNYAFSGCTSIKDLSSYTLPDTVTSLYYAFNLCSSLTKGPAIPNSVTDMTGTYYGCTALSSVSSVPSNVTSIAMCFMSCKNLVSVVIDATPANYNYAFQDSSIYSIRMSDGTAHPKEAELLAASGKSNPFAGLM